MTKIRVLIVEDSAVVRMLLQYIIARDSRLEVAAVAGSAEEALRILETDIPDVIAMDIRLPGINGLEATRRIMATRPIPIVVVAASVRSKDLTTADLSIAMEALRAGALTVLEKPVGTTHADYEAMAERLCTQLVIMSQVQVVRRHVPVRSVFPRRHPLDQSPLRSTPGGFSVLGIACSTGGPAALAHLLAGLGPDFPVPILLVQHMLDGYLPGFASWLQSVSPFSVAGVKDGEIAALQTVHIAPAERHLRLRGGQLFLDSADPVSFQRPSGTVLFQSMAQSLGPKALGLLLTGMGDDGALGLFDMRQAGGYTIAEDEGTAVVYGMPGAAVCLGAVCESVPLPEIAPRVLELVSAGRVGA